MLHPLFRNVVLVLLAGTILARTAPASAASLPRLEADSLGGTHVVLPTDAAGKPFVLLLAFTEQSQADVTAWSRKLLADHVADRAPVYVVAVADRAAHFMRRRVQKMVTGSAVGNDEQKQNYVLITFDGAGWRELVPPGDKKTAGVVVVDATGAIVYAKREPFNESNVTDVEHAAK